MIDMKNARNVFIALGGSGGHTMKRLWAKMSEEERGKAKCIYLDTDQRDTEELKDAGINAVAISTADTVREIAHELDDSRVTEWLPCNNANQGDRKFLDSEVHQGASQNRFKSRLCMARYLKNPGNELHMLLKSLMTAGSGLKEPVRVVIVSSIAGGTGAGTFIDVALYVRKFMRARKHESVRMIGVLGCPDLYTERNNMGDLKSQTKKKSMYANAYAAIRELNAMNLATVGEDSVANDYGKNIKIAIDTESEGRLFDSTEPEFTLTTKAGPFDQIYFIDEINAEGGSFSKVEDYYEVMADLSYVKLYSPLRGSLETLESNELDKHIKVPTAIYGSAGYARMIYPYEDILKYLAHEKTVREIDGGWRVIDRQWHSYCERETDKALAFGRSWQPRKGQRGEEFVKRINMELDKGARSSFMYLAGMVEDSKNRNYAEQYLQTLQEYASCSTNMNYENYTAELTGGMFSVLHDDAVSTALESIVAKFKECGAFIEKKASFFNSESGAKTAKTAAKTLENIVNGVVNDWADFSANIHEVISMQAGALASAILPASEEDEQYARYLPADLNLRTSLLSRDGKEVHPLAARYLLYSVQSEMQKKADSNRVDLQKSLSITEKLLKYPFDPNVSDNDDVLLKEELDEINRYPVGVVRRAEDAADAYLERLQETMNSILETVKDEILAQAYEIVLVTLDELVTQYEGFFDSLGKYQEDLAGELSSLRTKFDLDQNQNIYIGASSLMKDHYMSHKAVMGALNNGTPQYYAAAGRGIYEAMIKRARKKLEEKETCARLQKKWSRAKDKYDDLQYIFEEIKEIYVDYLRENCAYLKTDVLGALINETSRVTGIEESERHNDAAANKIFVDAMQEQLENLKAKAQPMISYEEKNEEKYYNVELDGKEFDVSITYSFIGLSEATRRRLTKVFPAPTENDSMQKFKQDMVLENVVVDESYSDYEIFCFGAVHCLQPTQIHHFHENSDDSYYKDYREKIYDAVANKCMSASPHLDKRWHLKGCMPFISRELEGRWRTELMKAFLYRIVSKKIVFSEMNGSTCFYACEDGHTLLEWPAGEPIVTQNISRLLEYIAEDEKRVRKEAEEMDKRISTAKKSVAAQCKNSVGLYKNGMTTNELLVRLKTNTIELMTFAQSGSTTKRSKSLLSDKTAEKVQAFRQHVGNTEEEPLIEAETVQGDAAVEKKPVPYGVVDSDKTMGDVLHLAWLIKQSEESLGEDRDYAETLMKVVGDMIDQISRGLHGEAYVDSTDTKHKEYVDVYNHAVSKFLMAFVEGAYLRNNWDLDDYEPIPDDEFALGVQLKDNAKVKAPQELRATAEFAWIRKNLPHKAY